MSEYVNHQPHWRCRLCGFSSPISASVCGNPSCGADLAIYGEAVTPGPEEQPSRWEPEQPTQEEPQKTAESSWEETQEPEEPQNRRRTEERRESEETRDAAAERQRAAEERARKKAARKWRRQGPSKGLIAGLICLALIVCGGLWAVFSNREPASGAAPGPSNSVAPPPVSSGEPTSPEPDASVQDPEPWRKNVLMADPCGLSDVGQAAEYPVFGSTVPQSVMSVLPRKAVGAIIFRDSLDGNKFQSGAWDVSEAQDRSVLIKYDYNSTTEKYDLFIGAEGGVMAPANCSGMFYGYVNLDRIDFGGAFHTENVRTMEDMFNNCGMLTELDLSGFDTSGTTVTKGMFFYCTGLKNLDVSGFDTSQVTDMSWMFCGCESLTELDVSGFNTGRATDTGGMFFGCSSLTELDVSSFDTSHVTSMYGMFSGCSGLAELDISNFKTGNVISMESMLAGVRDDFVLHYSPENFDTSKVTNNKNFMPDSFDWEKMFD